MDSPRPLGPAQCPAPHERSSKLPQSLLWGWECSLYPLGVPALMTGGCEGLCRTSGLWRLILERAPVPSSGLGWKEAGRALCGPSTPAGSWQARELMETSAGMATSIRQPGATERHASWEGRALEGF